MGCFRTPRTVVSALCHQYTRCYLHLQFNWQAAEHSWQNQLKSTSFGMYEDRAVAVWFLKPGECEYRILEETLLFVSFGVNPLLFLKCPITDLWIVCPTQLCYSKSSYMFQSQLIIIRLSYNNYLLTYLLHGAESFLRS